MVPKPSKPSTNILSSSVARLAYQPDFIVHEGACYITGTQLQLVFTLLDEKVDPVSIPEYVGRRTSGVDLTVEDVEEIKNGDFHMSSSDFHVRMPTSGKFIHIDVINDYYLMAKSASSLGSVKSQLEDEYGIVLSDHDILDMSYGSFHIAGRETMDLATKDKTFVPSSFISEAAWMLDRQLPCDFVLQHLWYRFHVRLSFEELIHQAVMKYQDLLDRAALKELLQTSISRPAPNPPCLKQTARRALPPLPIIIFPAPIAEDSKAERVAGWTFTANPDVLCHQDDGAYSMRADFEDSDLDSDSKPADSIMADIYSRVLIQLEEGDYLVDLEKPGVECIKVRNPTDGAFSPTDDTLTSSSGRIVYPSSPFSLLDMQSRESSEWSASTGDDTDDDTDIGVSQDSVLEESTLESDTNSPDKPATKPETPDLADLPTLGKTIQEGLGWDNDEDLLKYFLSDDALSLSDMTCEDLPSYDEIDDFAPLATALPPTMHGLDLSISADHLSRSTTSSSYHSQAPSAQDAHTLLLQPEVIELEHDAELERGGPPNSDISVLMTPDFEKLLAAAAADPDLLFDVADPSLEDEEVAAAREKDRREEKGGAVKKSKRSSVGCDRQVQ